MQAFTEDEIVRAAKASSDRIELARMLMEAASRDRRITRAACSHLLQEMPDCVDVASAVLRSATTRRLKLPLSLVLSLLESRTPRRVRYGAIRTVGFLLGPLAFSRLEPFLFGDDPLAVHAATDAMQWAPTQAIRYLRRRSSEPRLRNRTEAAMHALAFHTTRTSLESVTPTLNGAHFVSDAAGNSTKHVEVRGFGFWNVAGENDETDLLTVTSDPDDDQWLDATGFVFHSAKLYAATVQHTPPGRTADIGILVSVRGRNGEFIEGTLSLAELSTRVAILPRTDELRVNQTSTYSATHTVPDAEPGAVGWAVLGDAAALIDTDGDEVERICNQQASVRGKTITAFNEEALVAAVPEFPHWHHTVLPLTIGPKLPELATDAGLLARLIIASCSLPGDDVYEPEESRRAMTIIKAVIDNRLNQRPERFGAPGAATYADVILAPGEFEDFTRDAGGNVVVSVLARSKIDSVFRLEAPSLRAASYQFVRNVLEVVYGPVDDPFAGINEIHGRRVEPHVFAWTHGGAASPGDSYVAVPAALGGVVERKQFYLLKKSSWRAFVAFRSWRTSTRSFEPLATVPVDLVDYNPVSPNKVLRTETTDNQGRVEFVIDDLDALGETAPDLFFLVRAPAHNPLGLPDEWPTKGWTATDGSPGYFEDVSPGQIGSEPAPLVYSVGVDLHLAFEYQDRSGPSPIPKPVPSGLQVDLFELVSAGPNRTRREIATLRTDEIGQVHAVLIDVRPEQNLVLRIPFAIEDAAINLPASSISFPITGGFFTEGWIVELDSALTLSSIGSQTTPRKLSTTADELDAAFYLLKILCELQSFLFAATDGAWTGVEDLVISMAPVAGLADSAFAWPIGRVNFPEKYYWRRDTIIHELAHQVVWKQADFSSAGVGWEGLFGEITLKHHARMLTNEVTAFVEGWAEFMETVFEGPLSLSWKSAVPTPPPNPLDPFAPPQDSLFGSRADGFPVLGVMGPPPLDQGEKVEGAAAIALLRVYRRFVIAGADPHGHGQVAQTTSGDVISAEFWLSDPGVRARFMDLIWRPLQDLAPLDLPDLTSLVEKMQTRNSSIWHAIRSELNQLRIALAPPQVAAVAPTVIPAGASQTLTISGNDFVERAQVLVGGTAATNVQVLSSTAVTALAPTLAAGTHDVTVSTLGGAATLANAITQQ